MLPVLRHGRLRDRLLLPSVARTSPLLSASLHLGIPSPLQPVVGPLGLRLQLQLRVPEDRLPLAARTSARASPEPAALVRPRRLPSPPDRRRPNAPAHQASRPAP